MLIVVGLGNPGRQYLKTRHNVGFMVVERLVEAAGIDLSKGAKKGFSSFWTKGNIEGRDVILQLPQTFMNLSGRAVREIMDYFHVQPLNVMVVHDDLDLPLGRVKQVFDSGSAGHRGVGSMIESLGTKAFHRIRVGIGKPAVKEEVERYVLSPFEKAEYEVLEKVIGEGVDLLRTWILTRKNI